MPLMTRVARGRRVARAGFSLIELMVVIVLVGVIMGALYRVIDRQQRFYAGVGEVMGQRLQLRQAATVLPLELRSISSIGGDIIAFSDSTIELRGHSGSSVVCGRPPGPANVNQIYLPPMNLSTGQTLTSSKPEAGDIVFLYDDGVQTGNVDDVWIQATVQGVVEGTGVCNPSALVQAADNGKVRYTVTLTASVVPATVVSGAPVRFARQAKYSLFEASDKNWYLGYQRFTGGAYDAIEPVSGPYRKDTGLVFRLYRENGTQVTAIADADEVSRVDVAISGSTVSQVKVDGMKKGQYADSLAISVAIRNRNP